MDLSTFGEKRNDDSYIKGKIAQVIRNQLDASYATKRVISPKIAFRQEIVKSHLIHHIEIKTDVPLENDDIESLFSMNEELSERTLCVIPCYQTSSETYSYSDFENLFHIFITSSEQDSNMFSSS